MNQGNDSKRKNSPTQIAYGSLHMHKIQAANMMAAWIK